MRKILTVIALVVLASCTKQAKETLRPEKMTAMEVKKKYGIEIPAFDYTGTARGKKSAATVLTVVTDLTLTVSDGVFTTSISPNAEWGGVQRWNDTTGVSVCNWNWSYSQAPASMTCAANGSGNYRSWTSDKVTYDVHLSPYVIQ